MEEEGEMLRLRGVAVGAIAGFIIGFLTYSFMGGAIVAGYFHMKGQELPDDKKIEWRVAVIKYGAIPGALILGLLGSTLRPRLPRPMIEGMAVAPFLASAGFAWYNQWHYYSALTDKYKFLALLVTFCGFIMCRWICTWFLEWLAVRFGIYSSDWDLDSDDD